MLRRLTTTEYAHVAGLFSPLGHHLAVRALLAGAVPGQLYAPSGERPEAALAWAQQRLYLAGEPGNLDLGEAIGGKIGPAARARGIRYLGLHYAPESWAGQIEPQLQALSPWAAERHYYEFKAARQDWRRLLPAGYELRAVDRALLADASLGNLDQLKAEMCSERPSVEAFLTHSFGVCLVDAGALVGWCLSEYNHAGACEVGIETAPEHRRRRLGTLMATAFAERAPAAGIARIGWHCYAQNAASVATALAAGFEFVAGYPVLVLDLGPI